MLSRESGSSTSYSAVDCLSFVVMLQHEIHEVLAFDRRDFAHRFVVLPASE